MTSFLFESMGWLGAALFSLCAVPQAWLSYKQGHSQGISNTFIQMWFWGEILTFFYVLPTGQLPLLFNYIFNFLCLLVIISYKYWPRNKVYER